MLVLMRLCFDVVQVIHVHSPAALTGLDAYPPGPAQQAAAEAGTLLFAACAAPRLLGPARFRELRSALLPPSPQRPTTYCCKSNPAVQLSTR